MTYKIKQLNERCTKGMANETTQVHDYLILREIQRNRLSPDEIAEGVALTGCYTTKDPIVKSVNWHLNKLVKEGVVEIVSTTPINEPVVKAKRTSKKVDNVPETFNSKVAA